MTPDLFTGMDVDYGEWRPSLSDVRQLVVSVDALAYSMDNWVEDCQRTIALARKLRAWSVARAVCWLMHPETLDRHGPDAMHIRAERVARNWLERWERQRMEAA